jgi:hypothetical protein
MSQPYPTYPGDITVVAKRIETIVDAAKATFRVPVLDVWYGDQDRIPRTPAICIEPNEKNRTLAGLPNMTENEFQIYIMVYHNKAQDNQNTRLECDQVAFDVEKLLHQDLQLTAGNPSDPMMIHGFVRSNESGYTFKAGTLYRSARLSWFGKNKTSLPFA